MKKQIIILIALLFCNAFSWNNEIEIKPRVGFGMFFNNYTTVSKLDKYVVVDVSENYSAATQNSLNDYGKFKSTLGVDIKYNDFTLYFTNYLYVDINTKRKSFSPNLFEFYSGIKYQLLSNVSINYQHLCIHPVSVDGKEFSAKLYGGYNLIEITFGY